MDLDVFGPSEDKPIVHLGEDNVVIIKEKDAEVASNEEIPQAISELKIEPAGSQTQTPTITESTDPTPVALGTPQKQVC